MRVASGEGVEAAAHNDSAENATSPRILPPVCPAQPAIIVMPAERVINKENSPTSVISSSSEGPNNETHGAESSSSVEEAEDSDVGAITANRAEQDSGSQAAPADIGSQEESLAQLRVLGRQLLLGWADALGALVRLPGVANMRVEDLTVRLKQLAQEASPRGAGGAAAGVGSGEALGGQNAATAAAPSAAVGGGESGAAACAGGGGAAVPATALAGPACHPQQAYSDPVDMFATAAKSGHLSYAELLHAFAASAEGLDDEALADYLFNLAMLCAEPSDNELVVRPVLSLPQNCEEQQQYRRRQAGAAAPPVDAMMAAMQQQQQQQQQQAGVTAGGSRANSGGLTHEAIWQQILAQQQHAPLTPGGSYGRPGGGGGRGGLHSQPLRSKSDMLASYQQALADPEMQGLLRRAGHAPPQYGQVVQQYGPGSPLAPSLPPARGLQAGGPLAKAMSMPEQDLWLTAASLASEAEQKQQAAAAAAAASASFSFHPPQPPSPTFGHLAHLAGSSSAGGSGLWSNSGAGSGSVISRSAGGSGVLRSLSDLSY